MALRSAWTRFGIAIVVLIALALVAHFAGGDIKGFLGRLHGR